MYIIRGILLKGDTIIELMPYFLALLATLFSLRSSVFFVFEKRYLEDFGNLEAKYLLVAGDILR